MGKNQKGEVCLVLTQALVGISSKFGSKFLNSQSKRESNRVQLHNSYFYPATNTTFNFIWPL